MELQGREAEKYFCRLKYILYILLLLIITSSIHQTLSEAPRGQNCFHNKTKTLFAFFTVNLSKMCRDISGNPVVKTMLPTAGGNGLTLVRELRSCMPSDLATQTHKKMYSKIFRGNSVCKIVTD